MLAMDKGPGEGPRDRGKEAGQRQGQRRRRQGKEAGKQRIGLRQFFHWPVIGGMENQPHANHMPSFTQTQSCSVTIHQLACSAW